MILNLSVLSFKNSLNSLQKEALAFEEIKSRYMLASVCKYISNSSLKNRQ